MNAIVVTLLLPLFAGEGSSANVQLVAPGSWHGAEVDAESGDGWWGLFPTVDGYELKPAAIEVTRVHDGIVDSEGEVTGKRIAVKETPPPIFLIKGIEGLSPGPVKTVFGGEEGHKIIYPGERFNVSLSPNKWQMNLSAYGEVKEGESPSVFAKNYALFVEARDNKQEIFREEVVYEGIPRLIWAGDLDRDDQPDLLMNLSDHYNVTKWTLFFSSQADSREILRLIVQWITTGC